MRIFAVNYNCSFGSDKFKVVPKSSVSSKIAAQLPVGEIKSVMTDKKGLLVEQVDDHVTISSRFVGDRLREQTENFGDNIYKGVFDTTGSLVKKIENTPEEIKQITYNGAWNRVVKVVEKPQKVDNKVLKLIATIRRNLKR